MFEFCIKTLNFGVVPGDLALQKDFKRYLQFMSVFIQQTGVLAVRGRITTTV